MTIHPRILVTSSALICLSMIGSIAAAQQTSPPIVAHSTSGSGDSLEEIVVTATKRESTVQTTPIAISALSEAELQNRGITTVEGLVAEVPGLAMRSNGPGQTEFEMRGLTSSG